MTSPDTPPRTASIPSDTTPRQTEPGVSGDEPTSADLSDSLVELEPLDGIPDVIDTPRGLTRAVAALSAGSGPVGVDAERASGFRYGQRAYLIQLYRRGGGTWLIDPIALPDLRRLGDLLAHVEWIVHAASQDLPCLAEIGLRPTRLFDTELAGRLLGRQRVGLAPLVAAELGWHLAKGHGAADWSTRPLPDSWRRYAALDVEVLPDLRDRLYEALQASGKAAWADEEFQALVEADSPPPRIDPWRRTSGLHSVRTRRGLGVVRSLWLARDDIARVQDLSPGRVLPDAALVAAATQLPDSPAALAAIAGFSRGRGARWRATWWAAIEASYALQEEELPEIAPRGDGPPPPRLWAARDPKAARRLSAAKVAMSELAVRLEIPVENLGSPDAVRRVLWAPPDPATLEEVTSRLAHSGLRPWQRALVAPVLLAAIQDG